MKDFTIFGGLLLSDIIIWLEVIHKIIECL